jgi:NADH dehydrogenase
VAVSPGSRKKVLILGGGFAGIGAARKLEDADADVVLVDKHNYHTFQPLLYQVATDLLEQAAVGHPLRDLLKNQANASVHQATATAVDLGARTVSFDDMPPAAYDYLVIGLGADVNFFDTEGADEHAFPMYTLADALRLRMHVLERWEAADKDPSLLEDGALNVVVVGGGATGIETAGAMAELYRHIFSRDYKHIPQEHARLILVEAGGDVFTMFKTDIRAYTKKTLAKFSVEVLTGQAVAKIGPTRVTLASGQELKAHTLVWGAGLQANPIAHTLGIELERGNRIPVGADLSIAGHPEVFATGDIAAIDDPDDGHVLPQLGSVALQSGECAGENIARLLAGKETEPFDYTDKGTMATIGRGSAVVQFKNGRTLKGRAASLAWGTVHLALLSTGEDRAKAMVNWSWNSFAHERPGRISVDTSEGREA